MKKIFALTLIFLCLSITTTFAYENPYPLYWNDDKNFPMIWARQGMYCYLDKTSIKIILDDHPFYIISVKVLVVSYTYTDKEGNSGFHEEPKIIYGDEQEFFYDYEERDMRIRNRENQWVYLKPSFASENKRSRNIDIGESIFYLTQRRKFYGNSLAKDILPYDSRVERGEKSEIYRTMFSDSFYELLDGKFGDDENL